MSFYYTTNVPEPSNGSIHIRSFRSSDSKIAFSHHNHMVLELIFVTEGALKVSVDDNKYHLEKGDIAIFNPFQLHYGEWVDLNDSNEYLCLTLSPQKIFFTNRLKEIEKNFLGVSINFAEYISSKTPEGEKIGEMIYNIQKFLSENNSISECNFLSETYKLLALLLDKCSVEIINTKSINSNHYFSTNVTNYINEHYTERISTSDIAKALYIPITSFCRTFNKNYGMPFTSYLCKFRITKAIEIYKSKYGQINLSDLASLVGFSDYYHFSKMFKKYMGASPSQFFKNEKK